VSIRFLISTAPDVYTRLISRSSPTGSRKPLIFWLVSARRKKV
jgi:hypothetical protein